MKNNLGQKPYSPKILQVINTLESGGAENIFIDLCNLLYKNNFKVSALFLRNEGPLSNKLLLGLEKISLNRKLRWSLLSIFKFLVISKNYDIIHIHSRHSLLWVSIALLFYPFNNVKIVFHDHYGLDEKIPWWFHFIKNNIGEYIGVSKNLRDWAINDCGLNHNHCHVISNFRYLEVKNKLPKRFKNKIIKLVHVANILRNKNLEHSLSLLKTLNKEYKITLTIFGKPIDKEYLRELKLMIANLKINKKVEFIHNENDIPSRLVDFDIGLCSSYAESGPLVLLEYINSGMPFISIKRGEIPNILKPKYSDFILENFDMDIWLKAFKKIISLNYESFGMKLQLNYKKYFGYDKYLEKINSVYQKAMENSN